jgi:hypothetical protein
MDVLGHDDLSDDYEAVAFTGLFEDGEEAISAAGGTKKRHSAIARASDKVQFVGAVKAMQAAGHEELMLAAASPPTLAKSARMGHPRSVMEQEKIDDRKDGPPAPLQSHYLWL